MQLHKQYKNDVVTMTLSLDYQGFDDEPPESFRGAVEMILKKQGVNFLSIICSDEADTVFERAQVVSIPTVLVYEPNGKLHRFEGEGAYEEKVIPFVNDLLTSSS